MVLDNSTVETIKGFVYSRPRNINEIALHIKKNWRTADRYVEDIKLRTGMIRTHTFREGTRGALKLVYWNNTEKIYATDIQEKLFKQIEQGIEKSDFSPFDIYQYVDAENRKSYFEVIKSEIGYCYRIETLAPHFEAAEKEICIFAGNLAFIHLMHKNKPIIDYMKRAVARKVIIKILTNINIIDLKNVEQLLSLNSGKKTPLIEVRHDKIPLRGYIFDNTILKFGEIQKGAKKEGEIKDIIAAYYEIRCESWINWMKNLFWKRFQNGIPSSIRIENIKSMRKLKNSEK